MKSDAARPDQDSFTAGLADPQPTLHDLRHAYATLQLAGGKTAHEVAQLLSCVQLPVLHAGSLPG